MSGSFWTRNCLVCGRWFNLSSKPWWVLEPYPPYRLVGRVHTTCVRSEHLAVHGYFDPMAARLYGYTVQHPVKNRWAPEFYARMLIDREYNPMELLPDQRDRLAYWNEHARLIEHGLTVADIEDAYWDLLGDFEQIIDQATYRTRSHAIRSSAARTNRYR